MLRGRNLNFESFLLRQLREPRRPPGFVISMPLLRPLAPLAAAAALAACQTASTGWAERPSVRSAPVAAPAPATASPADLAARILALHNRERAAVGAPLLSWDPALAASAVAYAAELDRLGRLVHSPRDRRLGQGENLWMGGRGAFGIDQMVGGWAAEKRHFRPGVFPDVSTTGNWSDVGHYTAMIWPTTERLGCGLYRGRQYDFLVCRYGPNGNIDGRRIP